MFDTAVYAPVLGRTEHVTRDVHEHRAPTDQSVALLKEMEAAARDKVIEAVKVGDTHFECVIHKMFDGPSGDRVLVAVFSVGGKKMRAEHRSRGLRWDDNGVEPYLALRDAIAEQIASHVLTAALRVR